MKRKAACAATDLERAQEEVLQLQTEKADAEKAATRATELLRDNRDVASNVSLQSAAKDAQIESLKAQLRALTSGVTQTLSTSHERSVVADGGDFTEAPQQGLMEVEGGVDSASAWPTAEVAS